MRLNGHEMTLDEEAEFLAWLAYTEGLNAAAHGNVKAAKAAFTEAIGYSIHHSDARKALAQLESIGK